MMRVLGVVCFFLLLVGCGGEMDNVPAGPPVDVPFAMLRNSQFQKPYIGKRIHTVAAFSSLLPSIPFGQYANGYVGAHMSSATPAGAAFTCDMTQYSQAYFVVPTERGAAFASAKRGDVFDIVGVLHESITGGLVDIESMKQVGSCP